MAVLGLNHINIVSADVDRTVRFYETLLDLSRVAIPVAGLAGGGCWLVDARNDPVIHLQRHDPARHGEGRAGGPTGAIDHVAFTCDGHARIVERCAGLGITPILRDFRDTGFRQIVVSDPNGVVLELNFAGD